MSSFPAHPSDLKVGHTDITSWFRDGRTVVYLVAFLDRVSRGGPSLFRRKVRP